MKKRIILLCAAAVLVAAAIVGGSLASISATGKVATNELTAQTLKVNAVSDYTVTTQNLMPGDTVDKDSTTFSVQNTAQTPAYLRITINKYFLTNSQSDGSAENWQKNTDLSTSFISMDIEDRGWLRAQGGITGNSNETDVLYYSIPLAPGETVQLPMTLSIDSTVDNSYSNTRIQLSVKVDAVQYAQGENELNVNGLLSTFGVQATLNSDGSISALYE